MARYVDAEELELEYYGLSIHGTMAVKSVLPIFVELLKKQPAADVVEVKYGYWEIAKGSNGKEKMVCTNCRHQQDLHNTFTYCPNCGALIDGRVIYND